MITKTFTLPPECFFHARPAGAFAFGLKRYQSMVMVLFGTEFADGKNAISLMRLSRFEGKPFEVAVDGADEGQTMAEVEKLLKNIFRNQNGK